ncbi:MAG: DoxX family protein [Pirellulales bacterium]|nr:DoxX family protein [Pirellulales bacterium]
MNKQRLAGWILCGLTTLFLIGPSAAGKFVDWDGKEEMFQHIGWSIELIKKIGVLEIVVAVLYFIPQTSFIGAILVTGYLGGATATHVRVGDPYFMPPLVGVVAWVGYALRRPDVVGRALCRPIPEGERS